MLIRVPQHTERDLEAWRLESQGDPVVARSARHARRVDEAIAAIQTFAAEPCYASTSWGKDSTVVAHLIATHVPHAPLVWVRREPVDQPYCDLVAEAFAQKVPSAQLHTIEVHCAYVQAPGDTAPRWWALDPESSLPIFTARPKQVGFSRAAKRFGERYVSGVRADESSVRALGIRRRGLSTKSTCAPLGRWTADDVFAYLHRHNLPIHPSYAMNMGGMLSRARIRVGSLVGRHGQGFGRAEWERRYYGWRLAELRVAR